MAHLLVITKNDVQPVPDLQLWREAEATYRSVLAQMPNAKNDAAVGALSSMTMSSLDEYVSTTLPAIVKARPEPFVTYEELCRIIAWKHTVGKFRPNGRHIAGNANLKLKGVSRVESVSADAFRKLRGNGGGLAAALQQLTVKKEGQGISGVGPATATAILRLVSDHIPYMKDEVLKVTGVGLEYRLQDALELAKVLQRIAKLLNELEAQAAAPSDASSSSAAAGGTAGVWTANRVEKTLFAAVRGGAGASGSAAVGDKDAASASVAAAAPVAGGGKAADADDRKRKR